MSFDNGPELPVYLKSRSGLAGPIAERIDQCGSRGAPRALPAALCRADPRRGSVVHRRHAARQCQRSAARQLVRDGYGGVRHARQRNPRNIGLDQRQPALCQRRAETGGGAGNRAETGRQPVAAGMARQGAAAEARPPRPLSPSAIAADDVSAPPQGAAAQGGRPARRGAARAVRTLARSAGGSAAARSAKPGAKPASPNSMPQRWLRPCSTSSTIRPLPMCSPPARLPRHRCRRRRRAGHRRHGRSAAGGGDAGVRSSISRPGGACPAAPMTCRPYYCARWRPMSRRCASCFRAGR